MIMIMMMSFLSCGQGRAGNRGTATSFINDYNLRICKELVLVLNEAGQEVPKWLKSMAAREPRILPLPSLMFAQIVMSAIAMPVGQVCSNLAGCCRGSGGAGPGFLQALGPRG